MTSITLYRNAQHCQVELGNRVQRPRPDGGRNEVNNSTKGTPAAPSFFIGVGMELPVQPDITYTGAK